MGRKSREKKLREKLVCNDQDKYSYMKSLPVDKRPRMLGPIWSRDYFQGRALLVVGILITILLGNGIIATIMRWNAIGLFCTILAIPFLLVTYVSICNGFASSNIGTYFRETEPIQYWVTNAITGGSTLLLAIGAWITK